MSIPAVSPALGLTLNEYHQGTLRRFRKQGTLIAVPRALWRKCRNFYIPGFTGLLKVFRYKICGYTGMHDIYRLAHFHHFMAWFKQNHPQLYRRYRLHVRAPLNSRRVEINNAYIQPEDYHPLTAAINDFYKEVER